MIKIALFKLLCESSVLHLVDRIAAVRPESFVMAVTDELAVYRTDLRSLELNCGLFAHLIVYN